MLSLCLQWMEKRLPSVQIKHIQQFNFKNIALCTGGKNCRWNCFCALVDKAVPKQMSQPQYQTEEKPLHYCSFNLSDQSIKLMFCFNICYFLTLMFFWGQDMTLKPLLTNVDNYVWQGFSCMPLWPSG